MALHAFGSEGLMPDRTLLLVLAEGAASDRIAARGETDRFGEKDRDYHKRLVVSFETMAAVDSRFHRIDADGNAYAVTARLLTALDDLL